ncbi:glycosyltransferase [Streptomyces sp. Pv4-95]|uniref:glycosyltransferase n=1 Tax=Streptomyces sp. Pv4-95 TaxID=3049543 RepID=UPI003891DF51
MTALDAVPRLSVALVSEHASPLAVLGGVDAGGQNVHVTRLAGALADRGHRVTVYTRRDSPEAPDQVTLRAGVTVRHVPAGPPCHVPKDALPPYMPAFGTFLTEEWRTRPPDIVHSHYWMSGLAALQATRELGLPLAHTYHALGTVKRRYRQDVDTSPRTRIIHEVEVGEGCDQVIATCRDEVTELERMGLPPRKISVVPCGVDTDVFTPEGPVADRSSYRPLLLQLGRLVPRKGAAIAVAALARLPEAELVIAGGPPVEDIDKDPEVQRLRVLSRAAGVTERVHFAGGVPYEDVPALLRAADVVLCPGDYEPFGMVPLEAMACGTPVVATAVGGQLDTVVDTVSGLLVPPGDPSALAHAIGELLADPEHRAACGVAGRRRVLARYGWDTVAAATETVYRGLLSPLPEVTEVA